MNGPRTVVVGTARSVQQLTVMLSVADPAPDLVGAILPYGAVASARPGCPVLGSIDRLPGVLEGLPLDQVLVSLPLAMDRAIAEVATALDSLAVTWRFLPTLDDQLAGRTTSRVTGGLPTASALGPGGFASAPLDVSKLIDREPRPLDEGAIGACLQGRCVMITGAGGSIGSELARQCARFAPDRLLLVERSENALFELDRELARSHPELLREAVLHDITRVDRTQAMLLRERPDVVFHAAAHKHVPMMEVHPAEAVENNFYGTRSIAEAAAHAGVDRFVMISTDKAVNPSSVMGATKRLAERFIQHLNTKSETTYAMVRFGNVLGSASSVLTIWADQLRRGGPITVTHPDMTRYFMTIPEAAGLVLQAGALSRGGEVFLLDMGEPIAVLDLAKRFIRLQGFTPDVDVDLKITGIRPGEKLFEELAYHGEGMIPTEHEAIRVWATTPPNAAELAMVTQTFDRLRDQDGTGAHLWADAPKDAILRALRSAVPEMVAAAAG